MSLKLETQRERRSGGDPRETLDIKISDELGTRSYETYRRFSSSRPSRSSERTRPTSGHHRGAGPRQRPPDEPEAGDPEGEAQRGRPQGDPGHQDLRRVGHAQLRDYEERCTAAARRSASTLPCASPCPGCWRIALRGRSVGLPTLFIDEGFGSQDAAGLEKLTNIEAINAIQNDFQKSRSVFLVAPVVLWRSPITHIEELKEAFPVRIEVTKTLQGWVHLLDELGVDFNGAFVLGVALVKNWDEMLVLPKRQCRESGSRSILLRRWGCQFFLFVHGISRNLKPRIGCSLFVHPLH